MPATLRVHGCKRRQSRNPHSEHSGSCPAAAAPCCGARRSLNSACRKPAKRMTFQGGDTSLRTATAFVGSALHVPHFLRRPRRFRRPSRAAILLRGLSSPALKRLSEIRRVTVSKDFGNRLCTQRRLCQISHRQVPACVRHYLLIRGLSILQSSS